MCSKLFHMGWSLLHKGCDFKFQQLSVCADTACHGYEGLRKQSPSDSLQEQFSPSNLAHNMQVQIKFQLATALPKRLEPSA